MQRFGKSVSLPDGSRCNAATELGKTCWAQGIVGSGTSPGARQQGNAIYRLPLLMLGPSMLASTAIGAAKGALEAYLD